MANPIISLSVPVLDRVYAVGQPDGLKPNSVVSTIEVRGRSFIVRGSLGGHIVITGRLVRNLIRPKRR